LIWGNIEAESKLFKILKKLSGSKSIVSFYDVTVGKYKLVIKPPIAVSFTLYKFNPKNRVKFIWTAVSQVVH